MREFVVFCWHPIFHNFPFLDWKIPSPAKCSIVNIHFSWLLETQSNQRGSLSNKNAEWNIQPHSRWNNQLLVGAFRCRHLWFYCSRSHFVASVNQIREDLGWAICHPIKNIVRYSLRNFSFFIFFYFFPDVSLSEFLLSDTALGPLRVRRVL